MTPNQQGELLSRATEDARLFVREFGLPLNPSRTDWDSMAFAEARADLPWLRSLAPAAYQHAWHRYQDALVAETHRLVDASWRLVRGDETRQVEAQAGAWYIEPKDYEGDTLWSPGFPTPTAAVAWFDSQPADEEEQGSPEDATAAGNGSAVASTIHPDTRSIPSRR